ncbi:MAG TPA: hypothetical protein VK971_06100 [Thiohalobacter sp.]|nr:hypothetical protein [Thiohalobacter sp.]
MFRNTSITGLAVALLVLGGTASAGEKAMMSGENAMMGAMTFEALDRDGDGYISAEEAGAHKGLEANWDKADANQDGHLDSSEFSAFEGEGRLSPPEESEISEPGAAPYSRD